MKINIRHGKIEDCKACFELTKKTKELDSPLKEPVPLWWFEELAKKSNLFVVAEKNNEIVGFQIGEQLIGNGAIMHLLAVKPKERNKGIGKYLLDAFEKECKSVGIEWILCYGFEDNQKTIAFFEKKGYNKGALTREFLKLI